MLDFSFGEILLVVVVAVVFIGPKELPVVVKAAAKGMRAVKSLTAEVKRAFHDIADETGLSDAKKDIDNEMRMIKGDDGKFYPSYDLPVMVESRQLPDKNHDS